MVNLLVEWEPNFKQTKQKLNYSEIWSLAISPEQKVITARDNNCMIYDMGKCKDFRALYNSRRLDFHSWDFLKFLFWKYFIF